MPQVVPVDYDTSSGSMHLINMQLQILENHYYFQNGNKLSLFCDYNFFLGSSLGRIFKISDSED